MPRADQLSSYKPIAATFVTLALVYGVWYAYSVFLVALLREFGWSRSVLAGAFSLFTLVHGGLGLPLGWLADRVGPRRLIVVGGAVLGAALLLDGAIERPWQLYLTFGLMTALGIATAGWVPAVMLVQRAFPHRIGTALGFTSAGVGFGIFLVVPICQWLIDQVGWRWAFRFAGLVVAAWVIPATLWLVRDTPPRAPDAAPAAAAAPPARGDGARRELTLGAAMRTLPFWLFATLQASVSFANQMLLVHQIAYLVDHGIQSLMAASVVSVIGITSVCGKIGGGWVSDFVDRRVTYTVGTTLTAASIGALGLLAVHPTPGWAYLYGVLIGVGYSIPAAITPAIINDVFRGRHFGAIFGSFQIAGALGGATGPWVAGRVFDVTGSYAPAFIAAAVAAGVATAALWGTRRRTR